MLFCKNFATLLDPSIWFVLSQSRPTTSIDLILWRIYFFNRFTRLPYTWQWITPYIRILWCSRIIKRYETGGHQQTSIHMWSQSSFVVPVYVYCDLVFHDYQYIHSTVWVYRTSGWSFFHDSVFFEGRRERKVCV